MGVNPTGVKVKARSEWLYDRLGLFNDYQLRRWSGAKSRPGTMGPLTLGTRQTGASSAEHLHAEGEVAGVRNGFTIGLSRPASGMKPRLSPQERQVRVRRGLGCRADQSGRERRSFCPGAALAAIAGPEFQSLREPLRLPRSSRSHTRLSRAAARRWGRWPWRGARETSRRAIP